MGLLQINKKTINEDYILISILHKGMPLINDTYFLVETITNEHLDDIYLMKDIIIVLKMIVML